MAYFGYCNIKQEFSSDAYDYEAQICNLIIIGHGGLLLCPCYNAQLHRKFYVSVCKYKQVNHPLLLLYCCHLGVGPGLFHLIAVHLRQNFLVVRVNFNLT